MIKAFDSVMEMPQFLHLAKMLHDEGAVKDLAFDENKMINFTTKEGLFLELAWEGEEAVGFCSGWVEDTFFGDDLVAHQHLWFVVPKHRGSAVGPIMLKRFQSWAFDRGAKEVWVSQATGINSARTLELFEALGFEMVGFIARKAA